MVVEEEVVVVEVEETIVHSAGTSNKLPTFGRICTVTVCRTFACTESRGRMRTRRAQMMRKAGRAVLGMFAFCPDPRSL